VFPGVEHFGNKQDVVYADYSKKRLVTENFITSCALLDRATYIEAGGMCQAIRHFEDYDFWLRLASINVVGRLFREPLFQYRRHAQGRSAQVYAAVTRAEFMAELRHHNPVAFGDLPAHHELTRNLPCYKQLDVSGDERRALELVELASTIAAKEGNLPHPAPLLRMLTDLVTGQLGDTTIISHRLRVHHKEGGPSVMYIIPWMVMGGADLYDLHILGALRKEKARVTLVTCVDTTHSWEPQFAALVDEIFHLPRITNDSARVDAVLDHLLLSRNVDLVFSRNNDPGYRAFERWRTRLHLADVVLVDILHLENKAHEQRQAAPQPGWEEKSLRHHDLMNWRIVASRNLLAHITETQGLAPDKFTALSPAVDSRVYSPQGAATLPVPPLLPRRSKEATTPVVTFVGRFEEQKDPVMWVRVAAEVARASETAVFLMIGDGWMRPQVEYFVREAGLSQRFVFTGRLEHAEVLGYLAQSHVLLLTSLYEGVPIVILEGKPLVQTNRQ